ncbi:MAG: hypothetical protein ACRELZ_04935 [Candidatus Rokuibacteriota bacterium]
MSRDFGFAPREWRALRALRTPGGVQRALEAMPYHIAASAWSPRRVLREGTAHCLEGAIFAAAALRVLGFAPLILDLEAVQDTDHVISVYRLRGHWGAIAKTNFSGLRFREPVYRSVRELVMSYFESYVNLRGERTLRAHSRPINLARFDRSHRGWMTSEGDLWWIAEHLVRVSHTRILTAGMIGRLSRVDRRSLDAGLVGYRGH